ncbi:MAG: WYL domain-containing protein [Thermoleophilia bacterium]|jgi:proteasome accessory factor C
MSINGRKIGAEDIRRCVEGYDSGRSPETFARRFFSDRDDLANLGIEIRSERDEYGEGDVYSLPPENFFLPAVTFSHEELMSLHTCLYLLDGQFAYSNLLRLALQSLALGTGNTLEDPETSCVCIDLPSSGFDDEAAKRLAKIDDAKSNRKTIKFSYHSFGSDAVEERVVDPYSMMYTHDDWYMVGWSHERSAIRIFKLRRIHGRITNLSKKSHDFKVPEDFNAQDYANLAPWQLGPASGTADIDFTPRYGWWAGNNLSALGEIEHHEDGSATLHTVYSDGVQLCSLVLARSADSHLLGPPKLRGLMVDILKKIASLHQGAAPETATPAAPDPGAVSVSAGRGGTQVEPERFSQLAKTVTYLMDRLEGEEFVTLPVEEVCHDLGFERSELANAMAALSIVSADFGGYLVNGVIDGDSLEVEYFPHGDLLKKPPRLTPREARAMLLAIDLVGQQILAGQFPSLETAREKIIQAAGGIDDTETIPVGDDEKEDYEICRAINRGMTGNRLVEIEYLSSDSGNMEARVIEPYLVSGAKGNWYLVAWCRKRDAIRTFRFEMIKSARLLKEGFKPRALDLVPYRSDPRFPSGKEAPRKAKVWFSPVVARWVHEKQPGTMMLEDGSLLAEIAYFQQEWMIDEILRYCGEAVLLAPDDLRVQVGRAAKRLVDSYQ